MAKECTLNTGKLPVRCLPRNSVVRITDCADITSVECEHNAINQTNKTKCTIFDKKYRYAR